MTDSHRELGQHWLDNAIDWYSQVPDTDPWERSTASALIAGVFFLAARDEDFDGEEQHQSEKFASGGLVTRPDLAVNPWPGHRELDEDNPDTLVEGDGSCPHDARRENPDGSFTCIRCDAWSRYGWSVSDLDADTIARPISFGGILDTPRTDFYGTPGPWSAA